MKVAELNTLKDFIENREFTIQRGDRNIQLTEEEFDLFCDLVEAREGSWSIGNIVDYDNDLTEPQAEYLKERQYDAGFCSTVFDYLASFGDSYESQKRAIMNAYADDIEITTADIQWKDSKEKCTMLFSDMDTTGTDIDDEIFFCGVSKEDLQKYVGADENPFSDEWKILKVY